MVESLHPWIVAAMAVGRFVGGLSLLIYEATQRAGEPRWSLLLIYGGMMSMPFAELGDRLRRAKNGQERA